MDPGVEQFLLRGAHMLLPVLKVLMPELGRQGVHGIRILGNGLGQRQEAYGEQANHRLTVPFRIRMRVEFLAWVPMPKGLRP